MGAGDFPKGARLSVPGLPAGVTVFVPKDAPMGRAQRRELERQDRRERKRLAALDKAKGGAQ